MKTLEEVINIMEGVGLIDWGADALYYLKMYRSDMQMYAENQKHWEDELMQKIKDFGDAKERFVKRLKELDIGTLNEPLTWEQLKTMEGKPVWIEWISGTWKGSHKWVLIGKSADVMLAFASLDVAQAYTGYLREMGLGKSWQAYRKENV